MTPNVSLPMYNVPEMRADNARFWEALRELLVEAGLRDLPERLTFDRLPVSMSEQGKAALETEVLAVSMACCTTVGSPA